MTAAPVGHGDMRDVRRGGVPAGEPRSVASRPLVWLVQGYQRTLSPVLGPVCRYYPSCSAYAVTALERHGAFRGSWLTAWRLLRCNPFSRGGVDHVPARHAHAPGAARHTAEGGGPSESTPTPVDLRSPRRPHR